MLKMSKWYNPFQIRGHLFSSTSYGNQALGEREAPNGSSDNPKIKQAELLVFHRY